MILEIILSVIVLALGYVTFNQMKKIEYYEDYVSQYEEWITVLSERIEEADIKLREIDNKGTFQSDDEVGYFFDFLKRMIGNINVLNQQVENINADKEEKEKE
tara:strand:- start:338 stop:646 length:309 start_codon:yes stop_codon:yes gene_type:complete